MLSLPKVTLLAIDCYKPERTVMAMRFSTRWVKFGAVILLTDTKKHPHINPWEEGVQIHHIEESDRMQEISQGHKTPVDYEMDVLRRPPEFVRTGHVLFMEWDSAVLNPLAWNNEWIKLDFIGAPWQPHNDPGWPPCDGITNAVGNGGFSLKSIRFCELCREATEAFKGDQRMLCSDSWMGRCIRVWMEARGMVYATPEQAMAFSCENRIYSGEFGYHGAWTANMNGWDGAMFNAVKEKARKLC